MSFTPAAWDISLALAIVAGNFLVDAFFLVPLPRRSPDEIAIARRRCYYALLIFLCGAAVAVCALWHFENRNWGSLLLAAPLTWRFLTGLAVAGAFLLLVGFQYVSTPRRARNDPGQPISFGSDVLDALVPRSRSENRLFACVAVAAGVCEELLFRGFLMALLASWLGLVEGAALSVVLFGVCHAYQGPAGIARTGAFAAVATALALGSGSLIPVMIVHAAADLSVGDLAFRLLGNGRVERAA